MVNGNGSLYARVGGEAGVEQLVDEFYKRVLADDGLGVFFSRGADGAAEEDAKGIFRYRLRWSE